MNGYDRNYRHGGGGSNREEHFMRHSRNSRPEMNYRNGAGGATRGGEGHHYDPHDELYGRVNKPHQNGYHNSSHMGGGTYELDHLATFTVSPKQAPLQPEDGIMKLRQMERSNGIWTMKCQMLVEPRDVIILDQRNGDEMERFPLHLVTDPTAVTNRDRRDVYNNILLFTVLEDPHSKSATEMHIFQSVGRPAQDLVDDLRDSIRNLSRHGSYQRQDPRGHVRERIQEYEDQGKELERITHNYPSGHRPQKKLQQSLARPGDNDSVFSEGTDRDVDLLNHCFDDIEKFVARLQQAAESYKELGRRRQNRQRQRAPGDGMLTMRARPPPAKDFLDIFQKFKLAFNLLAKLKAHIHDPNAPELVHFLFTPLSLIVEASRDPAHHTPDLAAKVVSPLLTPEGKDLLENCLNSKESDLWLSLGDAWCISSAEWRGYVPPFNPRFYDGWQPQKLDDDNQNGRRRDERVHPDMYSGRGDRFNDARPRDSPPVDFSRGQIPPPAALPPEPEPKVADYQAYVERHIDRNLDAHLDMPPPRAASPPAPVTSQTTGKYWRDDQAVFVRELQQKGAKMYEITHDREARNPKELTVRKGEVIEVLENNRNWWRVRNNRGDVGHAPYTIIQEYRGGHLDPAPETTSSWNNDVVDSGRGVSNNVSPSATTATNTIPPPPSPRPDWSTKEKKSELQNPNGPGIQLRDALHSELIRATHGRSKGVTRNRSRLSNTKVYMDSSTSPDELQQWLTEKGFGMTVRQRFVNKTGSDLFRLNKETLEILCGKEDGSRLHSVLTVQKNISGFTIGRAQELNQHLVKWRARTDIIPEH